MTISLNQPALQDTLERFAEPTYIHSRLPPREISRHRDPGSTHAVPVAFGSPICGIVGDLNTAPAVAGDPGRPGEDVAHDHCTPHARAHLNLRLVFAELAAADEDGAALDLQGVTAFAM